jgi:hypothetical protein
MDDEINEIEFHVNTVKQVFQTRNSAIVNLFKQNFHLAMEPKHQATVIYLAFYSLSETDPESFTWALHQQLRASITAYALHQLMAFGFILGTDFSSLPGGNIILCADVYHFLIKESLATSAFVYLLLRDILRIGRRSASYRLPPLPTA